MSDTATFDESVFQELISSNLSVTAIEKELRSKGINTEAIADYLKKIKKNRIAKRQSVGFIYLAIGAFVGFLSCVFTITNIFPNHVWFVLYVLTSLAVIIIVRGLYFVFE